MTKVFYLSWLPVGGFTPCQSFLIIKTKYKGDNALLQHELAHVEQMKRIGTLKWIWGYLTSRKFRQAVEVEAYKVSIINGANLYECARHLQRLYLLGITIDQAIDLLSAEQTYPWYS